jgi:hypothetical protein
MKKYFIAATIFLACWFIGAAYGTPLGLLFGAALAYEAYYVMTSFQFPRIQPRKMLEPMNIIFTIIIAMVHVAVAYVALPSDVGFDTYRYLLLGIFLPFHIGLMILIISSRDETPKAKKIAVRTYRKGESRWL